MTTPPRRILIVNGHPDAGTRHLLHRLIDAYANGAQAAGHALRRVDVSALHFPFHSCAVRRNGSTANCLRC